MAKHKSKETINMGSFPNGKPKKDPSNNKTIYWGKGTKAQVHGLKTTLYTGFTYSYSEKDKLLKIKPYFYYTNKKYITEEINKVEFVAGEKTIIKKNMDWSNVGNCVCQKLKKNIEFTNIDKEKVTITINFKEIEGVGYYSGENKNLAAPTVTKEIILKEKNISETSSYDITFINSYNIKEKYFIKNKTYFPHFSETKNFIDKMSYERGKAFESWNSKKDASGIEYNVGDKLTKNITVYAIWAEKEAKIYYKIKSGLMHNEFGRDVRIPGGKYCLNSNIVENNNFNYISNLYGNEKISNNIYNTNKLYKNSLGNYISPNEISEYIVTCLPEPINRFNNQTEILTALNRFNGIVDSIGPTLKYHFLKEGDDNTVGVIDGEKRYLKNDGSRWHHYLSPWKDNWYYVYRMEWLTDGNIKHKYTPYYLYLKFSNYYPAGLANAESIGIYYRMYYNFIGWSVENIDNEVYTYSPYGKNTSKAFFNDEKIYPFTRISDFKEKVIQNWIENKYSKTIDITIYDRWSPKTHYMNYIDENNEILYSQPFIIAQDETGNNFNFIRKVYDNSGKEFAKKNKVLLGWRLGNNIDKTKSEKWCTDLDIIANSCIGRISTGKNGESLPIGTIYENGSQNDNSPKDALLPGDEFINYLDDDLTLNPVWRNFIVYLHNPKGYTNPYYEIYYDLSGEELEENEFISQTITITTPSEKDEKGREKIFLAWVDSEGDEPVVLLPGETIVVDRDYHFYPTYCDETTTWIRKNINTSVELLPIDEELKNNLKIKEQLSLSDFGEVDETRNIKPTVCYSFKEGYETGEEKDQELRPELITANVHIPHPDFYPIGFDIKEGQENLYQIDSYTPTILLRQKQTNIPLFPGHIFNGWYFNDLEDLIDNENNIIYQANTEILIINKKGIITEEGKKILNYIYLNPNNRSMCYDQSIKKWILWDNIERIPYTIYAKWERVYTTDTYAYTLLEEDINEELVNIKDTDISYGIGWKYIIPQYLFDEGIEHNYNDRDNLNNKLSQEKKIFEIINGITEINETKYSVITINNKDYIVYNNIYYPIEYKKYYSEENENNTIIINIENEIFNIYSGIYRPHIEYKGEKIFLEEDKENNKFITIGRIEIPYQFYSWDISTPFLFNNYFDLTEE